MGLNCHHGPHHMQESFTHIELPEHAYLSCYPNASLLDIENSEFKYSDNAQYFGQVAQNLIREGVRLLVVAVVQPLSTSNLLKNLFRHLNLLMTKSDSDTNESTFQSISK